MSYQANRPGTKTVQESVVSGTTKILELADSGTYIRLTNESAKTVTVPPQSDVVWLAGTVITLRNVGVGILTLIEGSGVTLLPNDLEFEQNDTTQLIRVSEDTWDVI